MDLMLADDPHDCDRLQVDAFPILVTLCKIGDNVLVDPSAEEEECSLSKLVVGVSCRPDSETPLITATRTAGTGSFHQNTLTDSLQLGCMAAECLNRALMNILRLDETTNRKQKLKMESVGFLK